jgi:hypothetical protein
VAAAAAAAAATTKSKVKAKTKAKVEANQQQEEDSEEDGEACEICRSSAATKGGLPMLLCDGARCGKGFHAVCVGLDAAPEQEVYLGR